MDPQLKATLEQLIQANVDSKDQMSQFVNAMKPKPSDPLLQRAEKVQKLAMAIKKDHRLKDFKHTKDSNVRVFIKKVKEEISSYKPIIGIVGDLERNEYVPIFRQSLDFTVLDRLGEVFKMDPAGYTWENISVDNLHKLMIREFGVQDTDVASVLGQFGSAKITKAPETTVAEFYHDWYLQIPDNMKPSSDEECRKFVDLIHRSMFYVSLNDKVLQKALCELKNPDPDLKAYLDEATLAEANRRAFETIRSCNSNLEASGGIAVAKLGAQEGTRKK